MLQENSKRILHEVFTQSESVIYDEINDKISMLSNERQSSCDIDPEQEISTDELHVQ